MTKHGRLLGYARVSKDGQNLDAQVAELKRAGCTKIYTEHASGAATKNLIELNKCIEETKPKDVIVVCELSRFGRSLKDLLALLETLKTKEVGIKSLKEHLDTNTPMGYFIFQMLGGFSEFERNMISERTKRALQHKKKLGVRLGRPQSFNDEEDAQIHHEYSYEDVTYKELAKRYNVSIFAIYSAIRRAEEKLKQSRQKYATTKFENYSLEL